MDKIILLDYKIYAILDYMRRRASPLSLVRPIINKQDESGGFVVLSSPPPMLPLAAMVASSSSSSLPVPASSAAICIDYAAVSRVISDDERSDHGRMPIGYWKQQQAPQVLETAAACLSGTDSPSYMNTNDIIDSQLVILIYNNYYINCHDM